MKYVPFLKAKQNEIRAVSSLSSERLGEIIPFFDIPRPDKISESNVCKAIATAKKNINTAQKIKPFWFYLDVFDLPSEMSIGELPLYEYVLNEFAEFSVIPVIGLDREPEHLQAVLNILSDAPYISIRLVDEDLISFNITKRKLTTIISKFSDDVSFDLILDCRLVNETNYLQQSQYCSSFINRCDELANLEDIIVTASTIPSPISELIEPQNSKYFTRYENQLWSSLNYKTSKNVIYGDYTVISPEYSDATIPVEMMRNVQCPKVIYSDQVVAFGARGGALKTHGDYQFYDLADKIVNCGFFRGENFSKGDEYIYKVANKTLTKKVRGGLLATTCGSPSKWIEVTVNCHISFIVDNL